ncbi:MAG: Asp-tRNA(Asn)/Glu-tRNA(Gln) amidotransferase subunit GatC [Synergistetes bacterium]|nr:Asp-tRNA(Asn)/Glu-tRNA(Gln) amidotransferase subunit GatC [Synergistota bacterium]
MKISMKDVEHVMKLAYLDLKGEEKERMLHHFNRILEHFAKLQELDTEKVEPLSHVIESSTPLRKDEIKESLPREEILKIAPETEKGYIKVPRIVE